MKGAFALALLVTVGSAAAQGPPAPPAKHGNVTRGPSRAVVQTPIAIPEELSPLQEIYAAFPQSPGAAAVAAPSACQLRLAKIAVFRPIPVLVGPGECGALDAVSLEAVMLADKTKVTVAPIATLRCTMAEQVANWVRDDVAPEALKLGAAIRGLDNLDSYECRGRNRVRGAKLSEHGRANALDVHDFKLADGRVIGLTDVKVDKDWREAIRASACARFSTVLGPGSDGSHEEHIHLDLAERHNNYKICEWDVRTPIIEAEPSTPSGEDKASQPETEASEAGEAASTPLADVPLPRPRPGATSGPTTVPSARR